MKIAKSCTTWGCINFVNSGINCIVTGQPGSKNCCFPKNLDDFPNPSNLAGRWIGIATWRKFVDGENKWFARGKLEFLLNGDEWSLDQKCFPFDGNL